MDVHYLGCRVCDEKINPLTINNPFCIYKCTNNVKLFVQPKVVLNRVNLFGGGISVDFGIQNIKAAEKKNRRVQFCTHLLRV
jgi:hypothetical protein